MARILIVDDRRPILDGIKPLLERCGYEVLTATSGRDALSCETPDLLLTDIQMPFMDGVKLAIRFRERCPTLPILFQTCGCAADLRRAAEALGPVLDSGLSTRELVAAIERELRAGPNKARC